jgi:capsular polysaccharide biosynthesis protein
MDQLAQRLLQNTVESESRGANVVQLDPAVEPLEPVSPKVPVILAMGLLAAPMLGSLVAALAGALDRRVLVDADIERALGCAIITVVPRSRSVRRAARRPRTPQSAMRLRLPWSPPAATVHDGAPHA